ncbi:MAG: hypothetical protein CM15mV142_480 [Caudoviricetes sp.]|nr:MAG: hypothetical protein CM15mV142_480 [Caudoviricetes sp.]
MLSHLQQTKHLTPFKLVQMLVCENTEVSSVSIRGGDHDRSRSIEYQWRNYGLQANGTIAKTFVAANSELAYGHLQEV